eukprot:3092877-Rhodomonas_salina.1
MSWSAPATVPPPHCRASWFGWDREDAFAGAGCSVLMPKVRPTRLGYCLGQLTMSHANLSGL